ncbi:ATP-binding protein [Pseudomonas viridiflava]|uniref:ATP-binding protein n=1 Tax=Pseudomonas viridiflava TaxID=33069 RepID=UPI000F01FB13|nr:ATP-binding protein [Pseudomonas viridiflava]MCJ8177090.1 ATP-binding protein [Pseudomonas viridiflava]MDY0915429.1 ATP-binding protein [Pseudomonas viridiflava]MEE4072414.1 ATP-binding protein [Pseudomonas viridiflava]MEE4092264.1 ATP-binding protein [Pseudomonas viridiflava]
MLKMLARLYLILLVTYTVALYAVPELVLKVFEERNLTYNHEQVRGTLKLIKTRFTQVPQASWPQVEHELQEDFAPLQLRVLTITDPSVSDCERTELEQGRNALRTGDYGMASTVMTPLSAGQVIQLVFPDPPVDINIMYWLMNVLIGAALLGCLSIWFWPHWRDLQRLKHTAMMLGNGNLAQRTHISPRSNIGELAQVFDKMAQDIGQLLNQQQELLSAVSHELRTPLSRLEFGMALVLTDPLEASTRLRLEQMVGHIRELDALIDELLSYTRLQSPYQQADRQEIPLQAFLDSVLGGFLDTQDARPFDLSLQTDTAPERFVLDPHLTARALQNLIANAIRYCSGQVRVSLRLQTGEGLYMTVEDDGIGIPESERALIFEPFYRMDRSRDRDTGGFGLGLAISRRAIECQGGRIQVDSSPLGGARFLIVLPCVSA